jgi:hypothetical protein
MEDLDHREQRPSVIAEQGVQAQTTTAGLHRYSAAATAALRYYD